MIDRLSTTAQHRFSPPSHGFPSMPDNYHLSVRVSCLPSALMRVFSSKVKRTPNQIYLTFLPSADCYALLGTAALFKMNSAFAFGCSSFNFSKQGLQNLLNVGQVILGQRSNTRKQEFEVHRDISKFMPLSDEIDCCTDPRRLCCSNYYSLFS